MNTKDRRSTGRNWTTIYKTLVMSSKRLYQTPRDPFGYLTVVIETDIILFQKWNPGGSFSPPLGSGALQGCQMSLPAPPLAASDLIGRIRCSWWSELKPKLV
mmetsp:Transcript_10648/g.23133  ORF Transcript_10648/g.23133 Transcript_10648/m.23133 type:complete len:102 (-) Transcript_10648:11-316(-)